MSFYKEDDDWFGEQIRQKLLKNIAACTFAEICQPFKFLVYVNISDYIREAVRSYQVENRSEKLVYYISCMLSAAESNDAHIENERLTVVFHENKCQ